MNILTAPVSMHRQPTHEEISQRAQALWAQRGQPSGQDDEIWLEAERQLLAEAAAPAAPAPAREVQEPVTAAESPILTAPKPAKSGGKKRSGGKGR